MKSREINRLASVPLALVVVVLLIAPPAAASDDADLVAIRATIWYAQVLDYGTTLSALQAGGREANPVLAPIVDHPAAFLGAKIGTAYFLDWWIRTIGKKNKTLAMIVGLAISSTTTYIAVRNTQVGRSVRH